MCKLNSGVVPHCGMVSVVSVVPLLVRMENALFIISRMSLFPIRVVSLTCCDNVVRVIFKKFKGSFVVKMYYSSIIGTSSSLRIRRAL